MCFKLKSNDLSRRPLHTDFSPAGRDLRQQPRMLDKVQAFTRKSNNLLQRLQEVFSNHWLRVSLHQHLAFRSADRSLQLENKDPLRQQNQLPFTLSDPLHSSLMTLRMQQIPMKIMRCSMIVAISSCGPLNMMRRLSWKISTG